jgi:hypothetical protein
VSDLVFISGDFSSGTTLLFTLYRQTPRCQCLYEPLHERLLPWLVVPPRAYEGHAFVKDYFREYKGLSAVPALFDPAWGISDLHLPADAEAPRLFRYLTYLIGSSFGRQPRVVLKENRFSYKLGWLKANFPQARIVHIWRDRDDQWESILRRGRQRLGRQDVGEESVDFMAFRLAAWCDDLAESFPELARERSSTGYERFSKLWERSRREQQRHADVSIELAELKRDFEGACTRLSEGAGIELDPTLLRPYLSEERRRPPRLGRAPLERTIERIGQRYAEARVARQAAVLRRRIAGE